MISDPNRALILASRSASRRNLLTAAGLAFASVPAQVDETSAIEAMTAEGVAPRDVADALAEMKALKVAGAAPRDAIVLGADQVLDLDGRIFETPRTREEARAHLRALRGKRHALHSAACAAVNGAVVWRHVATARLTMRAFSDAFLDAYLDAAGEALTTTAGAYAVEGLGLHLFSRIEGEQSVILGLPMLELLQFLRDRGLAAA